MRAVPALLILVGAYLVLCAVYIGKTPYRQAGNLRYQGGIEVPDSGAPDERQHANYVQHILEGNGFPVLEPGSPDLGETYQSHQPPLYYLLSAGWARLTDTDPTDPATGGRLRYVNMLIGALTLLGVFLAARWGLARDDVAVAAVAFAGLMPMFIALHAAVSNDPLLFLLCTWTVALCARGIRFGWDWRTTALCGVCAGLGLLTKTTAVALLPTILVALIASMKWSERKPRVWAGVVALLLPILIGLPWMVRNQNLYGDPFAISAFNAAFVNSPRPQDVAVPALIIEGVEPYASTFEHLYPSGTANIGIKAQIDEVVEEVGWTPRAHYEYWADWVGWWTARSFVGVFGYMDVFLMEAQGGTASDTTYRVFLAVLLVLAVAWAFSLRGGTDAPSKAFHVTGAALLLVVLLLFVRFNMQYFQGQARYLYPAVAPIAIGLGAGLCRLLGRRSPWAWAVAAGLLGAVQTLAFEAISDAFGGLVD